MYESSGDVAKTEERFQFRNISRELPLFDDICPEKRDLIASWVSYVSKVMFRFREKRFVYLTSEWRLRR